MGVLISNDTKYYYALNIYSRNQSNIVKFDLWYYRSLTFHIIIQRSLNITPVVSCQRLDSNRAAFMKKAKMHVSSHMLCVINVGVFCHRNSPRMVNTKERAIALWSCIQLRYIKAQEVFPLSLSLQQVPSKLNNVWIRYHNRQPMTCFSWTPTQAMLGISNFF